MSHLSRVYATIDIVWALTQKRTRISTTTQGPVDIRVQAMPAGTAILIRTRTRSNASLHKTNPGSLSACGCGWDGAVCAGPWPRSGGYARESHETPCLPLPECGY